MKNAEKLQQLKENSLEVIEQSTTAIELFKRLIAELFQKGDFAYVQLIVVNPKDGGLEVKAYASDGKLPMYDKAHTSGIIASSIKDRTVFVANPASEHPKYDPFDLRIQSELSAPILFNDSVFGALNFEDFSPDRFRDSMIEVLGEIVGAVSVKLEQMPDRYALIKERVNE